MNPHEHATPRNGTADVLVGGGTMGELMRAHDWIASAVGPVAQWPQSLRTAVSILLASRHPMFIWWGPELVQFYNDAYRPILGSKKHPEALGQRGRDCWPEIWSVIEPMIAAVMERGEATWLGDSLLVLDRHGFLEECYFDYAYSPIRDEGGNVGGVFVACSERTEHVIGERRLQTLRSLGERSLAAGRTVEQALQAGAAALANNPHDLPFALLYLLDEDGQHAHLVEAVNLVRDTAASPAVVAVGGAADPWAFHQVVTTRQSQIVADLEGRFGRLPAGPWADDWTQNAIVLPLELPGTQNHPAGFLVAGLSPRLAVSGEYCGFLELVAGHLSTALANARAYAAERARAEALAALDRAKTAFFANVSHEFRTPLTLMLGPLEETLAHSERLPLDDRERLDVAHRNALRLLKLVNTLLDFSRLEAGRTQAAFAPTDLAALTADLASVFRSAVEQSGLALLVDCPPLPTPVYVDRDLWEQIVFNLLSNAFKFTFAGAISVTLRAAGERVELAVRDTGTGIPAEELPHLFERFHRVQGARGRSIEGSGIGLALVKELVALHGGTIRVASQVKQGTTFTVSLPLGSAHLPAERVLAEPAPVLSDRRRSAVVAEVLRWLDDEGAGEPARAAVAPETIRAHEARVLLADDNADMRAYITRLLGPTYNVVAVSNGAAALEALRAQPFDLVLADVMMPELDGLGLLAAVRADEATRALPVILLSARAGPEARQEGLQRGADEYLVKPFGASDLIARVESALALARLRAQLLTTERRARQRAERLQAVTLALSIATTPAEVYGAVLAQGLTGGQADEEPLQAKSAALYVLDDDTLILAGSQQVHPTLTAQYQQIALEAPIPATAAVRTRSSLWMRSQADFIRQFPHLEAQIRQLAGEAAASLPLVLDSRVLGVLNCTFAQPLAFDLDEQNFLGTLASLAAQALERTRLFVALREREEHFRSFVELNPQVPWTADPNGNILEFNERWLTLTGLTREQALGEGWMQVPHPDDRPAMVAAWTHAVHTGEPYDIEHRIRLADGSYRWMRSRAFARQNEHGRIVRWYGTTEDIHDRKTLEAERERLLVQERAARRQAEEASRLKDEFLATVSHELRTPLTAFLGYAELLQRRKRDEAYVARTVEKMVRSAKAQAQLVEDLLDVSRIITGRLRLAVAPCNLVAVVQAAVDTVGPTVEARQLHLQLRLDPAAAHVLGDASRLQQVVWNLLSNAAKFTPEGGCIAVQLRASAGKAELTVSDSGQGIKGDFLPYVFDRFRQEDSSSQRAVGGLGLGLAIARHLVELHGGTIAAASDGEGTGATFTVRLPLSTAVLLDTPPGNEVQPPVSGATGKLAGRRIVIVDDQHDLLELIAEILTLEGALVRSCLSAREAVTLVHTWQPDVLVSDIAMPGYDGYWLIQALRALPPEAGGATPALALTAYVRIEDRLQVLAAGFNQYVPKPIEPDELIAVVVRLAQQRAGDEPW